MVTPSIANVYDALSDIADKPVDEAVVSKLLDDPDCFEKFVVQAVRKYKPLSAEEVYLARGLLGCMRNNWISEAGPDMKHGVWDHFKGGVYLSEGLGLNTDTDELEVEYLSFIDGARYHRRCSSWNEIVQWPDGAYRSRFVRRHDPSKPPEFKVEKDS